MNKKLYLSILAAIFTAVAVGLFAMLAAPIAKPLAWALIIGVATMPHHNRLLERFPAHPDRAAGLMVLAITICIMGPTVALVITAATNATDWYRQVEQLVIAFSKTGADTLNHLPLVGKIISLGDKFGIDLTGIGEKLAATSSGFILNQASNAAVNLFDLLFTLSAALFILFFIYRHGERVVSICIVRFAPNIAKTRWYVTEIRSITTAVTVGTIFTCCVQGVTAGIGYYFAGLPAPIFCGALTAVAAIVPVVGTGIVWVPLVALVAFNGAYLTALLLAIWCIIFVVLADNAVRPLAIGAASNIPVLAIVLGAVCGVLTMGLLGLILGPVIFAILMTVWKEIFKDIERIENADNPLRPPE